MQLHDIKSNHPGKDKKPRIGRGGKRGKTSGRGQKGQTSRAGHRLRPAERDLIIRLPKLRGYKNKPLKTAPQVLNLDDLQKMKDSVISLESLQSEGVIRKSNTIVKILGDGEITRALTISKIPVSKGAKKKIEAAGGKIVS